MSYLALATPEDNVKTLQGNVKVNFDVKDQDLNDKCDSIFAYLNGYVN